MEQTGVGRSRTEQHGSCYYSRSKKTN